MLENFESWDSQLWKNFFRRISWVVLFIILGISIGISVRNKQLIDTLIEARARAYFQSIVVTRRWAAGHGGVYVEKREGVESNPFLENPDIKANNGRIYTLRNPALITREISELAFDEGLFLFNITSLNPLNPNNLSDPFETSSLEQFEKGTKESFVKEERGDHLFFRFMAPLVTEKACLKCHEQQGYKVGDVRGGISVSFDITEQQRRINFNSYVIVLLGIVTFAVMIGFINYFIKILSKQLAKAQEELKLERERLLQSQKMASLGQMMGGVAHEVNTPLGIAITSNSVIGDEIKVLQKLNEQGQLTKSSFENSLSTLAEASDLSETNLTRAAELVRSFKKITVDQASGATRLVKIGVYLKEIVLAFGSQLKKRNISVDINCKKEIDVEMDAGALSQIITNLLQNCLLHAFESRETGKIEIRVREEDGEIELLFSDDGVGIDPALVGSVFEPFVTSKRNEGGSGLGLNILYNLVTQRLMGSVELDVSKKNGTAFLIHFPKVQPDKGNNEPE